MEENAGLTQKQALALNKNLWDNSVLIGTFRRFLDNTEGLKLELLLRNKTDGQLKKLQFEMLTRWKKAYTDRVLARFYKLNAWCEEFLPDDGCTFITFTTYQTGLSVEQQMIKLKDSFCKMRDLMRKYLGKFQYVWVTEPHKTGYAHIHMMAFKEISADLQRHFKSVWSEKYAAGDYEHGLNFAEHVSKENLRSAKNYLMKYVSKSVEAFASPGQKIYNAVAWKMSRRGSETPGFRFWGMSRNLGSFCKLDKPDESKYSMIAGDFVFPARKIAFPNKYFNDRGYTIWFEFPVARMAFKRTGEFERLQTAYKTLSFEATF